MKGILVVTVPTVLRQAHDLPAMLFIRQEEVGTEQGKREAEGPPPIYICTGENALVRLSGEDYHIPICERVPHHKHLIRDDEVGYHLSNINRDPKQTIAIRAARGESMKTLSLDKVDGSDALTDDVDVFDPDQGRVYVFSIDRSSQQVERVRPVYCRR